MILRENFGEPLKSVMWARYNRLHRKRIWYIRDDYNNREKPVTITFSIGASLVETVILS